jgi:hypothetical protein
VALALEILWEVEQISLCKALKTEDNYVILSEVYWCTGVVGQSSAAGDIQLFACPSRMPIYELIEIHLFSKTHSEKGGSKHDVRIH